MFATVEGCESRREMQDWRGCDDNGIDLRRFDNLIPVANDGRDSELPNSSLRRFEGLGPRMGDLYARNLLESGYVTSLRDVSGADYSDSNRVYQKRPAFFLNYDLYRAAITILVGIRSVNGRINCLYQVLLSIVRILHTDIIPILWIPIEEEGKCD